MVHGPSPFDVFAQIREGETLAEATRRVSLAYADSLEAAAKKLRASFAETPKHKGWIGVDFDGTLAHYFGWKGPTVLGEPIKPMVEKVKAWLAEGREVRIFTARAYRGGSAVEILETSEAVQAIQRWCLKHIGVVLNVTAVKDPGMEVLYDDRARQVITNEGRIIGD